MESQMKEKPNNISEKEELISQANKYIPIPAEKDPAEKKEYIVKDEDVDKILKLVEDLKRIDNLSNARRLLQLLYTDHYKYHDIEKWNKGDGKVDREIEKGNKLIYTRKAIKLIESLAVCTYKDTDLPSALKYSAAAELLNYHLEGRMPEDEVNKSNCYGILGSIFKKKWQYENNNNHLYRSLEYYTKGYDFAESMLKSDDLKTKGISLSFLGYCGINIAFVYDLLANINKIEIEGESLSKNYSDKASEKRTHLFDLYKRYEEEFEFKEEWKKSKEEDVYGFDSKRRYWFFVTMAEAKIGLGEFDMAGEYYNNALELGLKLEWVRKTASIQGSSLLKLRFQNDEDKMIKGKEALKVLDEGGEMGPLHGEKIGLALSGGGFRASLYHIGVLAQLAEAGILHKVEVISCVSGGSIIGAYYYLKLKNLLENSKKLTKENYIQLVKEVEEEFVSKTKKNLRLQLLSNLKANFKMAIYREFTRTSYTAELYDKMLFDNILKDKDENGKTKLLLNELRIFPIDPKTGEKELTFNPNYDNWKRTFKVPELVLNATTLNTGHSWQFTVSWMGESPAYVNSEFDALPTLRRMYLNENEAGEDFMNIRLSEAVAASAGVPGLFAPVEFENLYKKFPKVLVVDGGVHDNQGMSTLYERECNMLLISDASGQMPGDEKPNDQIHGVILRTNSILQDRVRQIQFRELESRKNSGMIHDYLLVHFTKELQGDVVEFQKSQGRFMPPNFDSKEEGDKTSYGINKDVQRSLARIRTDLDAFHDTESFGLMYSGYKMMESEIKHQPNEISKLTEYSKMSEDEKWGFLTYWEGIEDEVLLGKLEPSANLFGKLYLLKPRLQKVVGQIKKGLGRFFILGGVVVIVLIFINLLFPDLFSESPGKLFLIAKITAILKYHIILSFIVLMVLEWSIRKYIFKRGILLPLILGFLGFLAFFGFNILRLFNKGYLQAGLISKKGKKK